jgi:D-glycero-D-manno-heptose 1,7-bisphosphate phosphatase
MNRAVFLDRDGTMIVEKNYLRRPEDVEIFPAARIGLKKLCDAGFKLFIVSNQSGVGRGYFTLADVENVNRRLCPKRPASRAAAASRLRNFYSTRATSLI